MKNGHGGYGNMGMGKIPSKLKPMTYPVGNQHSPGPGKDVDATTGTSAPSKPMGGSDY